MRASVISQWVQMDPDGALEYAQAMEGDDRSSMVKQVAQSMTWMDPQRAGELLLAEAKTAEERKQAYSTAVSSWAYNDPNAAGEWLGEQDQGPELDPARQQFSMTVAQKDPESAMAWANAVNDDTLRETAVQNVYLQWAQKDREAANTGLASTDLSDEKISSLQEMELPEVKTSSFFSYGTSSVVATEQVVVEEHTDEQTGDGGESNPAVDEE